MEPTCEWAKVRSFRGQDGNEFSVEERNLLSVAGKSEGQEKELAKEELYSKPAGQGQSKMLYKQFEGEGRERELDTKVVGEGQEVVLDKQLVGEVRCEIQAKELYSMVADAGVAKMVEGEGLVKVKELYAMAARRCQEVPYKQFEGECWAKEFYTMAADVGLTKELADELYMRWGGGG